MVNVKRRLLPIALLIFSLVAAAVIGTITFGGAAHADDTHTNVILDEKASIDGGTPVVYTVPTSYRFGEVTALPKPRLKYDEGATLSVSLSMDGNELASGIEFDELSFYMNKYMPCGDYVLKLEYGGVDQPDGKADWWDKTASDDDTIETVTHYLPPAGTYAFSVVKSELDYEFKQRIIDTFGGDSRFIYDGKVHFAANDEILAELEQELYKDMRGGYWADELADIYYGGFETTYSFVGADPAHYHAQTEYINGTIDGDCADAMPVEPGKYRVYYNVSMRNYNDIAADNREDFVFRSIIMREVAVPVFTAEYDGDLKKPEIVEGDYTVVSNDGGVDAGTYDVVLRLRNPELYIWQGQSFDERSDEITVDFEITKAANGWVALPTVDRWTEGEYDAVENKVVGASKFGEPHIIITDENGNEVFNNVTGKNELGKAGAGVYTLTAYVSESANWYGISGDNTYTKIIRIYKKPGMAWWGIMLIVLGIAAVIALVFFLLDRLGILRVMSKKHVLKMRLDANMDATKAAMRFANAKKSADGAPRGELDAQPEQTPSETGMPTEQENVEPEPTEQEPEQTQTESVPAESEQTQEPSTEHEPQPEQAQTEVASEQTAQEPEKQSADAEQKSAKTENVKFLTEDMVNEYIYGMSSAQATAISNEGADNDGIIVATTFDKGEK